MTGSDISRIPSKTNNTETTAGGETLQMTPAELQTMLAAGDVRQEMRGEVTATLQFSNTSAKLQAADGNLFGIQEVIATAALGGFDDLLRLCQEIAELQIPAQQKTQCLRWVFARPDIAVITKAQAIHLFRIRNIDHQTVIQKLEQDETTPEEMIEMMSAIRRPEMIAPLFHRCRYKIKPGEKPAKDGSLTAEKAIAAMKERQGILPYAMAMQVKVPKDEKERLQWLFPLISALGDAEATISILQRFDCQLVYFPPVPEPRRKEER